MRTVADLTPGDLLSCKLPGDKKPVKRMVTDLQRTDALTTFRTGTPGPGYRDGGEVWCLQNSYGVKGNPGRMPRLRVDLFARAKMDDRTRLVLDAFTSAVAE